MKKILIIEDQASMRKNIAFILEMEGFKTCAAANGREGIDIAKAEKPDLILCDVMMPEVDGYGVLQALRQDPAFATMPFIFLSAKSDHNDIRSGMNLGADDYLTKPVVHEELMAAVHSRLERAGAVQQVIEDAGTFSINFDNHEPLIAAFGLTPREAEVVSWVAQGKGNADIGTLLNMTERTAKQHVSSCFQKMGVENRSAATLMAIEVLSGQRRPG
ncbi:MAG: response regulator transcription factor [Verrucomicrobiales bacterium]|nr:response regulator transcription factor [Verrucomicrobiales bacterium]MCP5558999.1 response regulator transcription factor [Verrucomicrobiaceae bacterium]